MADAPQSLLVEGEQEETSLGVPKEVRDFLGKFQRREFRPVPKEVSDFMGKVDRIVSTREPVKRLKPGSFQERSILGDITKSITRDGILGIAEGAFRAPQAIEAFFAFEKGAFGTTIITNPVAEFLGGLRQSEAISPNPLSQLTKGTGVGAALSDLNSHLWWTNHFPGMATSAVATLIPGMVASKLATRIAGMTRVAATKLGQRVSVATLFFSEAGSSFESMRLDLIAAGVSPEMARIAAGRGAVPSAILKAVIERGILPRQFKSGDVRIIERIIRGGVGEMAEEELQLLVEGVTRMVVASAVGASIDSGLNPKAFIESAVAAGAAGGAFGSFRGSGEAARKRAAAQIVDSLVELGIPESIAEKVVADKISSSPELAGKIESEAGLVRTKADSPQEDIVSEVVAAAAPEEEFDQSITDASDTFEPGAEEITFTHRESGGKIRLVRRPGIDRVSVLGLQVPEESRRQGIGKNLIRHALSLYPTMVGQFSSKYAAKAAHDLGMRPPEKPNATIEDVHRAIGEDSSVFLVPSTPVAPATAKDVFNFTIVTDKIDIIRDMTERAEDESQQPMRRLGHIKRLQEAIRGVVRHALADVPSKYYEIEIDNIEGVWDGKVEPSVSIKVEAKDEKTLNAIRARMSAVSSQFEQDELHEIKFDVAIPANVELGGRDGFDHYQPYAIIKLDRKVEWKVVEGARRKAGILGASFDGTKILVYNTHDTPQVFGKKVKTFIGAINESGRVRGTVSHGTAKIRRNGPTHSPEAGIRGYAEGSILDGEVSPLATDIAVRILRHTGGRLKAPDARSFFTAKDLTPQQIAHNRQIADDYGFGPLNDLKNPLVKRAYDAAAAVIIKQYRDIIEGNLKIEIIPWDRVEDGKKVAQEPYPDSRAAVKDIRQNKRLRSLLTTPDTFGPKGVDFSTHPLLQPSGIIASVMDAEGNFSDQEITVNDAFRVVHDAIAHGLFADTFGPIGEEGAWRTHIATISDPWARWAITTETRGQNSFVNYGPPARDAEGNIEFDKSKRGFVTLKKRGFAEQKAMLLPIDHSFTGNKDIDAPMQELKDSLSASEQRGSLSLETPAEVLADSPGQAKKRGEGEDEDIVSEVVNKATPEEINEAIEQIDTELTSGKIEEATREDFEQLKTLLEDFALQTQLEARRKPDVDPVTKRPPDFVPLKKPRRRRHGRIQSEGQEDVATVLQNLGVVKTKGRLELSKAQALRGSLQRQTSVAREVDRKARTEELFKAKQLLRELRTELKQASSIRKNTIAAIRKKLREIGRSVLSTEDQGKLIAIIGNDDITPTLKSLERGLRKINEIVARIEKRRQQNRLGDLIKKTDLHSVDPVQRRGLKEIVDAFLPSTLSTKKRNALEGLSRYLEKHPEARIPHLNLKELEKLKKTSVRDLTTDEAELLADQFEFLLHLSRTKAILKTSKGDHEFDKTIREMLKELGREKSPTPPRPVDPTGKVEPEDKSDIAQLMGMVIQWEGHMTTDTFIEFMFGSDSSVGHNHLHKEVVESYVAAIGRAYKNQDLISKKLEQLGLSDEAAFSAWASEVIEIETRLEDGSKFVAKATREEWADFIATMHDIETSDLIEFRNTPIWIKGHKLDESILMNREKIDEITNLVGQEAIDLAGEVVAIMNGTEGSDYGSATKEIFGRDLQREGVHYPRSRKVEKDPVTVTYKNFQQTMPENAGMNKDRTGDVTSPIVVMGIMQRYNNWNLTHSATIEMTRSLQQAHRLLNQRDINAMIVDGRGRKAIKRLEAMYDQMARQFIGGGPDSKNAGVRKLIDNLSTGFLGADPKIALFQVASSMVAMVEMPSGSIGHAIASGAMFDKSLDDEMAKADPWIRMRLEGSRLGIVNEASGAARKFVAQLKSKPLREKLMFLIQAFDRMALRTIWSGAKFMANREGFTGEAATVRAAAIARKTIMRTQPTFDPSSITGLGLEAKTNDFVRMAIMFRGQTSKNFDMTLRAAMRLHRGQITFAEFSRQMGLIYAAQGLWITSVRTAWALMITAGLGLLHGDEPDDEEQIKKFFFKYFDAMAGNILGGSALSFSARKLFRQPGFAPELSPVASVIGGTFTSFGNGLSALSRGDLKKMFAEMIKAGGTTTVALTGLPVAQASRVMSKVIDGGDKRSSRRRGRNPGRSASQR